MLKLSKSDIRHGYNGIKRLAQKAAQKGNYEKALEYVDHCTSIAGQFNLIYADDELETLMETIGKKVLNPIGNYQADADNWVLYDDWCTSYVLAIQWLEAMALTGKNILYITSRDFSKANRNASILDRAEAFKNVTIEIIPQGKAAQRAQNIYDAVVNFKASKLVLHKRATSSPVDLALYLFPKDISKYIINLSDQTFWIGSRAIDYCLEFRQFGASVSLQRRGLKEKQLLMVPFYPADDRNKFGGFPEECSPDKVIVFSGGDYYKTLNENRTYWKLVKAILEKYPQVVFLFATKNIPEGDAEIYQFIRENHFEGRFIYISFRPDIYQTYAHCDIYMGTSPTSGSLMSGLACVNAKPILQYYEPNTPDDETEQSVCFNEKFSISYQDEKSFMEEADRLITDVAYRKRQGERLKNAIISPEQFNQLVKETLTTDTTQVLIEPFKMDYDGLDDRWFYLEKAGYVNSMPYIYGLLGAKNCLRYAPCIFLKKNINRIMRRF